MKTFILAALVICAGPLFAVQTEVVDGVEWSFTVSNGQATIESGADKTPAISATTSGDLTIPSTLGGYPVTSIGDSAFEGCSLLTSAVIPEGVTSIGGRAFLGCSSLTSVVIPEDVTWIKSGAFQYCSLLTSVVIPEGVTVIGGYTFEGCSSLTSVVIPEGVTMIDDYTFRDCSSLTSVVIPEGVTVIDNCAFTGCSSLTSVVIPEGVTVIEDYVFSGCRSLTSVVIPEGVTVINNCAFENCGSLTSVVIPEGVTSIGEKVFSGCSSLTSVVIPEGVTSIGAEAFRYCNSLASVVIPESVVLMDGQNFSGTMIFRGAVPVGFSLTGGGQISFPQAHGADWEKVSGSNRATVVEAVMSENATVAVHAEMTALKTMRVSYTVTSDLPSVKVRAMAFKDGVRSFANIVPVRTGEGVPKGDSVETNVEHTFVWEVASDWATDLDKVAVEILVQGETLLPQEQLTIPATETHKAMTITRNVLTEPWLFDALVWCFAEGDERLQIKDGRVSVGGVDIAYGDKLPTGTNWDGAYNSGWKREATALLNYLYGKMGYKVLAGEDLAYAESATRLDFASGGLRQVSVKIDEGE